MSRQTRRFIPRAALLAIALLALGCASPSSGSGAPASTGVPSQIAVQPSSAAVPPSDDEPTPGPAVFSGTIDQVIDEVTNAGMVCGQPRPAKGFKVTTCSLSAGASRLSLDTYARANGDVAGVDMTFAESGPTDPDTLMSFVALGLGGAMGPDAFNTVADQLNASLDQPSPSPVWVSSDLRMTVSVTDTATHVTILAADLAAAWGP